MEKRITVTLEIQVETLEDLGLDNILDHIDITSDGDDVVQVIDMDITSIF